MLHQWVTPPPFKFQLMETPFLHLLSQKISDSPWSFLFFMPHIDPLVKLGLFQTWTYDPTSVTKEKSYVHIFFAQIVQLPSSFRRLFSLVCIAWSVSPNTHALKLGPQRVMLVQSDWSWGRSLHQWVNCWWVRAEWAVRRWPGWRKYVPGGPPLKGTPCLWPLPVSICFLAAMSEQLSPAMPFSHDAYACSQA